MVHQKIETNELKLSYCDCQTPTIQLIDKKNKIINSMDVQTFIERFQKNK